MVNEILQTALVEHAEIYLALERISAPETTMSMFDSFFNMGFKASKCKTLLKLTIPRIKLLRNKREHQIKQMRRDIAKLLETGQEATARVRVEHIIREENMMAAQELIELFCELISARLPIIETQRECPMDLKEAVSSLCFAAPRCADLPELLQVQLAFASKYGKEFIAAATQLMPACGVNRQLIELLSVSAPSAEKKLKLLKEIAEEHGLDWNPAAFESEIFKLHEDLLDGSTQFVIGSKAPLPEEKHEELLHSSTTEGENEQSSSDSGLDSLEFPKVPIAILRPSTDSSFTREEAPLPSAPSPQISHQISMGPEEGSLRVSDDETARPTEARQFVPFVYPPSSISEMTDPSSRSIPRDKNEMIEPPLQSLPAKSVRNFDLEDVLFAAQAAAESAEHAASAARSAASLAHIRISEISGNKNSQSLDTSSDNPFAMDNHENSEFNNGSSGVPTSDANESLFKTSSFNEVVDEQVNPHHLPQRTTSMDDDPYTSYPNLFGSSSRSFT